MDTTERTELREKRRPPRWRTVAIAVAAVIVVVAAVGGVGLLFTSDGEPQPAVDPNADPTERVEAYIAALNAGNVDGAMSILAPDGWPSDADRSFTEYRSFTEFSAVMNAEYPWQIEGCEVAANLPSGAIVECAIVNTDPVYVATGASELIAPWTVSDDGSIHAHAWRGGDHAAANRTYADYLRAFHLEDYEAVCSLAAYPGQLIYFDGGLAFTGPCAKVIQPLAQDIADWVEAGRPQP
jgi:hypothetical protein